MPTATMTSKGQITIPIKIRKALGLGAGDKIDFVEIENGRFAMTPRTGSIRDLKGCIPKLDYVPTIEQMDEAILDAAAENYLAGVSHSTSTAQKDEAA
jgi:AbrB family looped-hinge helix DNA binding protein